MVIVRQPKPYRNCRIYSYESGHHPFDLAARLQGLPYELFALTFSIANFKMELIYNRVLGALFIFVSFLFLKKKKNSSIYKSSTFFSFLFLTFLQMLWVSEKANAQTKQYSSLFCAVKKAPTLNIYVLSIPKIFL